MDENSLALRDLQIRDLTPEELDVALARVEAKLAASRERYREAAVSAECSGLGGVAGQLCAINATATADRQGVVSLL